jgi:hypothetical protein
MLRSKAEARNVLEERKGTTTSGIAGVITPWGVGLRFAPADTPRTTANHKKKGTLLMRQGRGHF